MQQGEHFRAEGRRVVGKSLRQRLPVRFRIGRSRQQRAAIVDLGLGGAFVACKRAPDVGVMLVMELRSPTAWDPLEIPCEVRWISDRGEGVAGFGVRFGELSESASSALFDLVESLDFEDTK